MAYKVCKKVHSLVIVLARLDRICDYWKLPFKLTISDPIRKFMFHTIYNNDAPKKLEYFLGPYFLTNTNLIKYNNTRCVK